MMAAAAAAAAASSGPPANPADTLRTYLPASKKPQWPLQDSSVGKKRKIVHQVFKDPLVITNQQKIGHVPNGKGPIVYKEVADPSDPDFTYMMCGECDSFRLFRNLTSLYKHRLKDCSTHTSDVEQVVSTKTPDEPGGELECIKIEAKKFLCQLSLDELTTQYKQLYGTHPPCGIGKEGLVDGILNHALSLGEIYDTQHTVEETVQTCADIPPICIADSAMIYLGTLLPRLQDILETHPKLSPLMLALATIGDFEPSLSRHSFDAEVQTECRTRANVQTYRGVVLLPVENDANPSKHSKRIPPVKRARVKPNMPEILQESQWTEISQTSSGDEVKPPTLTQDQREVKRPRAPRARRSSRLKCRE